RAIGTKRTLPSGSPIAVHGDLVLEEQVVSDRDVALLPPIAEGELDRGQVAKMARTGDLLYEGGRCAGGHTEDGDLLGRGTPQGNGADPQGPMHRDRVRGPEQTFHLDEP